MVFASDTFTFRFPPHPLSTPLTFPPYPAPAPTKSCLKRPLPLHDTAHIGSRKKRRLRLTLITSRLSRPFSTPATHAVDKGRSKIAVWAKSKRLCTGVLRKAAILNRMRRSWGKDLVGAVGKGDSLIGAVGLGAQESFVRPSCAMSRSINIQNPSPLGLSNYDALDEEDVWVELETDEDEETECYLSPPDFGSPPSTERWVEAEKEEEVVVEEKEEEHVQPKEEKNNDSHSLGPPTRSPNFVGGDVDMVKSPNGAWLASAFKVTMASEALASLGFMGKSLSGYRQDSLVEIKREKERQRRLLDLQLQF